MIGFSSQPNIGLKWGLKTVQQCQEACENLTGCNYFYRRDGTDRQNQPPVCILYDKMPKIDNVNITAHGMIFGSVACKGTSEICASMFDN